jgi:hypothetical protein
MTFNNDHAMMAASIMLIAAIIVLLMGISHF